jgi:ABC-type transporter Mla subunit MlaD
VALAAARGTVPPTPSATRQALAELMAARTQLRRFGTNVNQAVAALNATGEAPEWLALAVETTARAVRRVDEAAEALMRRRG